MELEDAQLLQFMDDEQHRLYLCYLRYEPGVYQISFYNEPYYVEKLDPFDETWNPHPRPLNNGIARSEVQFEAGDDSDPYDTAPSVSAVPQKYIEHFGEDVFSDGEEGAFPDSDIPEDDIWLITLLLGHNDLLDGWQFGF